MRIIQIIKKILDKGTVKPPNSEKQASNSLAGNSKGKTDESDMIINGISNELIYNELTSHFKQVLEKKSVRHRMLYPMTFTIWMHPDDYGECRYDFQFFLGEVVAGFYDIIRQYKGKYPNYLNTAENWSFQFSPCNIVEQNGHENIIEKGKIITTSALLMENVTKKDNVQRAPNVYYSIKCQNSDVNANNINKDALLGIDVIAEGTYEYAFDMNLPTDSKDVANSSVEKGKVLATLSWADAGGKYHFQMIDTYIEISGKKDNREARNICKIDSDDIVNSHVQIRYVEATKEFQLAAFATTRLNGRQVDMSDGSNMKWVSLPKRKSSIFMGDTIKVEFNANE